MSGPRVGDRIRIERDETIHPSKGTWPQFRGRTGIVVEINLGEYGVVFSKASPREDRPGVYRSSGPVTWFRDYEMVRVASAARAGVVRGSSPVSSPPPGPTPQSDPLPGGAAVPSEAIDYGDWSGSLAAAQCAACGRVFTGVTGFDRHRRGGRCLDPATIGLVLKEQRRRNGELFWVGWGKPGSWIPMTTPTVTHESP